MQGHYLQTSLFGQAWSGEPGSSNQNNILQSAGHRDMIASFFLKNSRKLESGDVQVFMWYCWIIRGTWESRIGLLSLKILSQKGLIYQWLQNVLFLHCFMAWSLRKTDLKGLKGGLFYWTPFWLTIDYWRFKNLFCYNVHNTYFLSFL